MSISTPTRPEPNPADRLAELEAELARVKTERDIYKAAAGWGFPSAASIPDPTDEEIDDALHGPRGQPLIELIAEFEREVGQ